jgi:hypothetical protein
MSWSFQNPITWCELWVTRTLWRTVLVPLSIVLAASTLRLRLAAGTADADAPGATVPSDANADTGDVMAPTRWGFGEGAAEEAPGASLPAVATPVAAPPTARIASVVMAYFDL